MPALPVWAQKIFLPPPGRRVDDPPALMMAVFGDSQTNKHPLIRLRNILVILFGNLFLLVLPYVMIYQTGIKAYFSDETDLQGAADPVACKFSFPNKCSPAEACASAFLFRCVPRA